MSSIHYFRRYTQANIAGRVFECPPMTVNFELPFGDGGSDGDVGTVRIYNPSPESIRTIVKGGAVNIDSGYLYDHGVIWLGSVVEAQAEWSGPDLVLSVTTGDSTDQWMTMRVSRSWKAGTKASQVASDLVAMLGLHVGKMQVANDIVYARGKAISGSIKSALEEIAKDTGSKLRVNQGSIWFMPRSSGKELAVVLNYKSGLLAAPQPIKQAEGDESEKAATWSVRSLLQHRMTTDSLVQIESSTANGLFRVVKGRHISDTGMHVTEMDVIEA